MKLIVGLGNPGVKYNNTRHNVGFMVLDSLKNQISNFKFQISNWEQSKHSKALYCWTKIGGQDIELFKPQTFMNDSGESVRYAYKKHKLKPDDVFVVHDDLDIRLGEYKIQKGVGPKLHNGIESIENSLKTKDFWRVRVGVDNRTSDNRINGEKYVLQNFTEEEKEVLNKVLTEVSNKLIQILRQ